MRSVRFVGFGPLAFDLFMETSWEGSEELSKQTNRWVDIGPGGCLARCPVVANMPLCGSHDITRKRREASGHLHWSAWVRRARILRQQ